MKTNSSQPPTNKRFVVSRKRRGLYHVTDTLKCVEYRTSDPAPFRPHKEVVVTAHPRDEIDYSQLARVLLSLVDELDE